MPNDSPLTEWRRHHPDGRMSLEAFGALCDPAVHKSTVRRWERDGVPLDRVADIARITGLPKHVLAPGIFDRPSVPVLGRIAAALQSGWHHFRGA